MKAKLKSIAHAGNHNKERLVLTIESDLDIGDYVIFQAGVVDDGVSTNIYQTYWFPYKDVSAGDLVVLYTKSGEISEKEMSGGGKVYFFYWDIGQSIWEGSDKAPVLLNAPEWMSLTPE